MIDSAALSRVKEIVGPENCHTGKEKLLVHGFDATLPQFLPDVVVFPVTT
ncbi:MAG: FAD-binding oxidoreductase, partial [Clostridia bacterium]|nr:FAD-binding oxidoreductase [Clostridia bacterium]